MSLPPLFSIIVPTYDRPDQLASCLGALGTLEYPRERYEVVVSDDGSPVTPAPLVARFSDRMQVRLVTGPNTGPAGARNRGAAQATGRFLLFTDDDCLPQPQWLAAYERGFDAAPDRLLAGAILNDATENRYATATQLIVTYAYARNDRRASGTRFFNSCNLGLPAEEFHRIGGFSESFPLASGEDYDFCDRWRRAGLETTYLADAIVRHHHPLTLAGFCRQHFNYGRGLYLCRRRMARRARTPFRIEAPSFYLGLLAFPLRRVGGADGWMYSLLVAGSQIATAVGAAREWAATMEPSSEAADAALVGRGGR